MTLESTRAAAHNELAEAAKARPGPRGLEEFELRTIDLFISLTRLLGLPKSIGEIYGLLFVSPDPMALDALVEKLGISKGSASQGLKFLRNLGAVKPTYVAGERRDHFVAETRLKKLVRGFIREELRPHLESGNSRLEQMEQSLELAQAEDREFLASRLAQLRKWQERGGEAFPFLEKLFDS